MKAKDVFLQYLPKIDHILPKKKLTPDFWSVSLLNFNVKTYFNTNL